MVEDVFRPVVATFCTFGPVVRAHGNIELCDCTYPGAIQLWVSVDGVPYRATFATDPFHRGNVVDAWRTSMALAMRREAGHAGENCTCQCFACASEWDGNPSGETQHCEKFWMTFNMFAPIVLGARKDKNRRGRRTYWKLPNGGAPWRNKCKTALDRYWPGSNLSATNSIIDTRDFVLHNDAVLDKRGRVPGRPCCDRVPLATTFPLPEDARELQLGDVRDGGPLLRLERA
jgi:hypothetical protein